ncbi:MAG: DUF721 domain-containing protein [Xenococcaceae cyanobacterium]
MSFNSIHQILKTIEKQPGWVQYQQYRRVLQCWEGVIEPKVALQTRPLYIARKVLWVATSSSVWAQTLSLQRYSLLKKLNAQLPEQLVDIRFSPAQWHNKNRPHDSSSNPQSIPQEQHPSLVVTEADPSSLNQLPEGNNLQAAFQRWVEVIKARSQNLPLCPQCQCPTPKGELQRWDVCAHCAAKQWAHLQQGQS